MCMFVGVCLSVGARLVIKLSLQCSPFDLKGCVTSSFDLKGCVTPVGISVISAASPQEEFSFLQRQSQTLPRVAVRKISLSLCLSLFLSFFLFPSLSLP